MEIEPLARFRADRARAAELQDPGASLCAFANVNAAGQPQVRTLVLREVEDQLAVFINKTSAKWEQPLSVISLCVYFDSIKLQYRLACTTQPISTQIIAQSWKYRPDPPKHMDWLYEKFPQSSVVESRDQLLNELKQVSHDNRPPNTASGLFLKVTEIERLDLNQDNGVHDRRRYRQDNNWEEEVLVP